MSKKIWRFWELEDGGREPKTGRIGLHIEGGTGLTF